MKSCHNKVRTLKNQLAKRANAGAAYDMVCKESLKQHYHYRFWNLAKCWDTESITLEEALLLAGARTRIAKVTKEYNFLGYRIAEFGIAVSMGAGKRFRARLLRLYEQRGSLLPLKQYIRHWFCWAKTGAAVEKLQLEQKINTILHFINRHYSKSVRSL